MALGFFFLVFKKLWLNYLIFEQRTTGDRDSEINTETVVALSILIIASSLHANKEFHQQSLVSRERLQKVKVENGRCSFAHIEFSY